MCHQPPPPPPPPPPTFVVVFLPLASPYLPPPLSPIIYYIALQIGFELPAYTFQEPSALRLIMDVKLIKEGNRITEQTYSVVVSVSNPPPPLSPATLQGQGGNYDYSLVVPGASSLVLDFGPNQQNQTFAFILYGNEIAEGTEGFEATSTANEGFPTFGAPQNISATTLITILDDECESIHYNF